MLMPSILKDNIFDDWMDFAFPDIDKNLYGTRSQNVMKTDIRETEQGYELDIDLPGYKKDEINVQLEHGQLTIQAAKSVDKEEKDKEGKYIRRERYAGAMSRSFYVGEAVEKNEIRAKFENGILKLSVPKKDSKAVEENRYIAIEG